MIYVHLFCNPFFDGHIFWKDVIQRLQKNEAINASPNSTNTIHCMVHQIDEMADVDRWIEQFFLQGSLHPTNSISAKHEGEKSEKSEKKQHIIVAHGMSIPFVSQISQKSVLYHDDIDVSFVLSNGPLLDMDVVSKTFKKLPNLAQRLCISSPFMMPFLASSLAFRRLVVNPYVMNSDMIVALCSNVFSDSKKTQKCIDYIDTFHDLFPLEFSPICPILACWGTLDVRYPLTMLTSFEMHYKNMERSDIEGGQHFHPIERPWEISDLITAWIFRNTTQQKNNSKAFF